MGSWFSSGSGSAPTHAPGSAERQKAEQRDQALVAEVEAVKQRQEELQQKDAERQAAEDAKELEQKNERQRIAEQQRVADQEEEKRQERLEQEQQKQAAEQMRLDEEKRREESAQKARAEKMKLQAEEDRKQEEEAERMRAEEKERLEEEKREAHRLDEERRLQREAQEIEAKRKQERERIANEQAEKRRLEMEADKAELAQWALEEEERKKQAAKEKRRISEALEEEERIKEEKSRLEREEVEKKRKLELERRIAEANEENLRLEREAKLAEEQARKHAAEEKRLAEERRLQQEAKEAAAEQRRELQRHMAEVQREQQRINKENRRQEKEAEQAEAKARKRRAAEEKRLNEEKLRLELEAEEARKRRAEEQERFDKEKRRLEQEAQEAQKRRAAEKARYDEERRRLQQEEEQIERERREQKHAAEEQQRQIAQLWPKPDWLTDMSCVNFAITGGSGMGKSSLINRLLNLGPRDAGAANVNATECTMDATAYEGPFGLGKSHKMKLWDLPGAGTTKFPRNTYIKDMGLRYFDGLLIVSCQRFTEIDLMLFKEAVKWEIPCYMVRNKGDMDCENQEEDADVPPAQTVQDLIHNMQSKLSEDGIKDEYLDRTFVITTKKKKYPEVLLPQYNRMLDMIKKDVERQRTTVDVRMAKSHVSTVVAQSAGADYEQKVGVADEARVAEPKSADAESQKEPKAAGAQFLSAAGEASQDIGAASGITAEEAMSTAESLVYSIYPRCGLFQGSGDAADAESQKEPKAAGAQSLSAAGEASQEIRAASGITAEEAMSTAESLVHSIYLRCGLFQESGDAAEVKAEEAKSASAKSESVAVTRLHGLGQLNSDLTGTYKPIRNFVKDFTPEKSVMEYIKDAGEKVLPQKALKYLDMILPEVHQITQSLLHTPTVKATLDKHNVQEGELFAMVLYSFDLELIWPQDWDGAKTDNWYYSQNVILQERNAGKLRHMLGFLFFFMSGLKKLPDWKGDLFRGIDMSGVEIIRANYTEGRRIHFSGSSSATPHSAVAWKFAGDKGVVLCLRVRHGRDIAFISAIPLEQEVLLFPNIAFIVMKEFYFNTDLDCNVVELLEAEEEQQTFVR